MIIMILKIQMLAAGSSLKMCVAVIFLIRLTLRGVYSLIQMPLCRGGRDTEHIRPPSMLKFDGFEREREVTKGKGQWPHQPSSNKDHSIVDSSRVDVVASSYQQQAPTFWL